VIVGESGTDKSFISRILGPMQHDIGAVQTSRFIEVGRDDLVAHMALRTIAKTRVALEHLAGGILLIDKVYSLLPSLARRQDHEILALAENVNGISDREPLVLLKGCPADMRRFLASDVGVWGCFPVQIELLIISSEEISEIFVRSGTSKGFALDAGVDVSSIAVDLSRATDAGWRTENNGRGFQFIFIYL